MNKKHAELAAEFLEKAAEEFSNHGCNDYILKNTPENRELYEKMMKESCGETVTVKPSHEVIYAQDWMLMSYLAKMLRREAENG